MRPNGAFPVSVQLPPPGNRTVETADPSNARRVPTRSSDPPARRPERSPTDSCSRKNRRGAPHGSTNRSHKIFGPPATERHANIRKCDDTFAPPPNGGFAGQRTAAKKPVTAIRQEITTTEYRNGGTHRHRRENRRRTAPCLNLVSGPSVPGNHRPGTEYLGKRRDITKIRIRNNRQPYPHRTDGRRRPFRMKRPRPERAAFPARILPAKNAEGDDGTRTFVRPSSPSAFVSVPRPSDAPHGRGIARSGASYRRLISFDPIKCPSA